MNSPTPKIKIMDLEEAKAFRYKNPLAQYSIQMLDSDESYGGELFPQIARASLKLIMDDTFVGEKSPSVNPPDVDSITAIINQSRAWSQNPDSTLAIHCGAGISRSGAAALIALIVKGHPIEEALAMLKSIRNLSVPNIVMISIADQLLSLNGKLLEKVSAFNTK